MHKHAHTHARCHTYTHTTYTWSHLHTHIHRPTYTHTHSHTDTYTLTHKLKQCMQSHTYIHIQLHTHTLTHRISHTDTHPHTNLPLVFVLPPLDYHYFYDSLNLGTCGKACYKHPLPSRLLSHTHTQLGHRQAGLYLDHTKDVSSKSLQAKYHLLLAQFHLAGFSLASLVQSPKQFMLFAPLALLPKLELIPLFCLTQSTQQGQQTPSCCPDEVHKTTVAQYALPCIRITLSSIPHLWDTHVSLFCPEHSACSTEDTRLGSCVGRCESPWEKRE